MTILGMLLAPGTAPARQLVDAIVAKVNGDVIIASELEEVLAPEINRLQDRYRENVQRLRSEVAEAKERLLRDLINGKLLEQEAKKSDIVIDDLQLEEAMASLMEQNQIETKAQFRAQIENELGQEFDDYKSQLRDRLKVIRFEGREFRRAITVLDNEIARYYEANPDAYREPGSATVKWFQLPLDMQERASEIRQEASQPGNWDDTIAEHSVGPLKERGGLVGTMEQESIQEAFANVIFALNEPGITEIVEFDGYLHFFNVIEIDPPKVKPLEEVSDAIARLLARQKEQARKETWLDQVYERSYVFVYEKRVENAGPSF